MVAEKRGVSLDKERDRKPFPLPLPFPKLKPLPFPFPEEDLVGDGKDRREDVVWEELLGSSEFKTDTRFTVGNI